MPITDDRQDAVDLQEVLHILNGDMDRNEKKRKNVLMENLG
jgi:hypothetical protein